MLAVKHKKNVTFENRRMAKNILVSQAWMVNEKQQSSSAVVVKLINLEAHDWPKF